MPEVEMQGNDQTQGKNLREPKSHEVLEVSLNTAPQISPAQVPPSHDSMPTALGAAFLGVTSSVLGRVWRDRLDKNAAREAATLASTCGFSEALSRILAGRGVTLEKAAFYLEPRLKNALPDPDLLVDMRAAVALLVAAIENTQPIAIFGDYDVDGACSAALLAGYLRAFGLRPFIHIPDRLSEGYGPNKGALAALYQQGARLLVCVDCGTSGHEALHHARDLGMKVIVLDHHQAPETLPQIDALVNPNRLDDLSGLGDLCAAGVVFLTLVALNRVLREKGRADLPDLMSALDLVALASVADVVPLSGLNRVFVAQGLKVMRQRERIGLAALADVARLAQAPEAWHLGFLLAPRINAGGRIGEASLGVRLLMSENAEEAADIAQKLDFLNRERQTIEEGMLIEAEEDAIRQIETCRQIETSAMDHPVLLVYGKNWHPGIIGIIAGRMKERFMRPAIAFANNDKGEIVGSGRSISGVDLGGAVRLAFERGLVLKGGGHKMAAGLTLLPEKRTSFGEFLYQNLSASVEQARAQDALLVDCSLDAHSLSLDFVKDLARAAPFGQANPEPLLVLPHHRLVHAQILRGGHIKITLQSPLGAKVEVMAFRAEGRPLGEEIGRLTGQEAHYAVHAVCDSWGGRERVSLRLVDMALIQNHS